jgi:diacylglycerol kinase (ATP)
MRAAAIFGLGCSAKNLKPFQTGANAQEQIDWRIGLPAAADQADVILIFGGDGTIHRHLNQLVRLSVPVLIVPAGSGNDFARALGLCHVRDSLAAWRCFRSGQSNIRTIDLGVIAPIADAERVLQHPNSQFPTQTYFCSVAGVGLDAEVARCANALPRWLRGHGGYALTLALTLFRFVPFPMKILASEQSGDWITRSDRPTMLAAFANTAIYGGGMKIAPHARMDDGRLDVCVIGAVDPFKLACMFPTVYFGRHLKIRAVKYFQAARLRVETGRPLDVYADGEYVCRTPVEVTVQRGALKVLVPQNRC